MFSKILPSFCVIMVLIAVVLVEIAHGQDSIFLKASKNVPRMGKRPKNNNGNGNNNSDDFEKFFLKASKSVPRIGRRRSEDANTEVKFPLWTDLAELYEYNPELFASPQLLARYLEYYNSQLLNDDPKMLDDGGWTKMRLKRNRYPDATDELFEYRLQP